MLEGTPMNERPGGGWQLVEDSAEAYQRYLAPIFFEPWADRLLAHAGVQAGERVLDVACGTGCVARAAARCVGAGGTVVGLDLNEGMLAVARRVSAGAPIEWREGDAASLPFADGSFDAVTCQQALQFFPDRPQALREMRRVLAPGGRAALAVFRGLAQSPAYAPLADALGRHVAAEAAAMLRSIFPGWTRDELRTLVRGAGFREVETRIEVGSIRYPSAEEFLRQEAACSPLAGVLRAMPGAARDALVRDLETGFAAHTDDVGVVTPMETWFVLARP
jgi:ubiquinone/menaquinone biosynthesis C-methylase UbiE